MMRDPIYRYATGAVATDGEQGCTLYIDEWTKTYSVEVDYITFGPLENHKFGRVITHVQINLEPHE